VISFLPFVPDSRSFRFAGYWKVGDTGWRLHVAVSFTLTILFIFYFLSYSSIFTFICYFFLLHLHLEFFFILYFYSHRSTSCYDRRGFAWGVRWKYQTFVA
jgi:hypothetical protein